MRLQKRINQVSVLGDVVWQALFQTKSIYGRTTARPYRLWLFGYRGGCLSSEMLDRPQWKNSCGESLAAMMTTTGDGDDYNRRHAEQFDR